MIIGLRRLCVLDECRHMRNEKFMLILVRKHEGKRLLGRLRRKQEDSSKIDLSCVMVVWIRFV